MNLTFRQLETFQAVARHLSFTRAAQELFLTQPAVSIQIKQLEEQLGLPLFDHIGKRIYLTQAGQELYAYNRKILDLLKEMEMVMGELKGLKRGKLALSGVTTTEYLLPSLLGIFRQIYPDIQVSLEVTNRARVLQRFANNEIDLAVMGQPPEELNLTGEPFLPNQLLLVASPSHPLTREKQIPLSRLASETFLVREPGSGTRMALERLFKEAGLSLRIGLELGSNEAIKQAIQAGLGLGVLSVYALSLELMGGKLVALNAEGFPLQRYWYLVYLAEKRLSPAARAFKEFLQTQAARELLQSRARLYRAYLEPRSVKKSLPLSRREQEVVQGIAEGYTEREIAKRLRISPKTVTTYRARVMKKLHLSHRSQLVQYALQTGLLAPSWQPNVLEPPELSRG
ncbi:MAG TPA: LysR substrate-binding domain-containing protein [Candidatus Limnocylindrales bacterium]|nr:LysR substrate-binding domain-containing protein [Candidatus Limnocylindrales bacterium]